MSLHLCDHCHKRRAAYQLEMTYPTPAPECVCAKCLSHVDGRQIAAQTTIEPMPEYRPATDATSAPATVKGQGDAQNINS